MTTSDGEVNHNRHDDESPIAENDGEMDARRDGDDNDATTSKEPYSTEAPAEQNSGINHPEETESRRTPEADYSAQAPTRPEDISPDNDPRGSRDDENRSFARDSEAPVTTIRASEYDHSGPGGTDGNGAAVGERGNKDFINLFVRNVAKHVMEEQLVDLFSKYGKVDSAVVVRDPHSKECRGFGFVKMYTEEDAKEAMTALQEYDFEGRKISVERAKRTEPHSRTPGAYMGVDRRIRDRYVGMKRHRDYEGGRYPPYPPHHNMRGGGYRGRHYDPGRSRPDERQWDYRMPYDNQQFDDRDRLRRRYNTDGPRYQPPREFERDQRYREREPPVPRESADDYI